jgi:hypothetical protein
VVPEKFMQNVINFDVQYLNLESCSVSPVSLEFIRAHNVNLKYLNISKCKGDDEFLANLIASSKSLQSINFGETRRNLVSKCIQKIPQNNFITTIDFTKMAKLCAENGPGSNRLKFESVKILIDNCRELIDVSFHHTGLSADSIAYICSNLTNKVLRINFCNEKVQDEDIKALAKNCKDLEYLNLIDSWVTLSAIPDIVSAWSTTLVDLSLPQEIGVELGLAEKKDIDWKNLEMIDSMVKLKFLHIGDFLGYIYPSTGYKNWRLEEEIHKENLRFRFPHLRINMDPMFDHEYPGDLQWRLYQMDSKMKNAGFNFTQTQDNFWFGGAL